MIPGNSLKSDKAIYRIDKKSRVKYWFYGICIFMLLTLFLPWTQNIQTKGYITTLYQDQRPQEINSPIPGKIQKWYVKEGDYIKKGDTILVISEIKEDYLDPNLINRTQEQVQAKKEAVTNYQGKINTAGSQIAALSEARKLKILQLQNKVAQLENKLKGEKAELVAAENDLRLSTDQFQRQQKMFEEGLVSQTQLQQRNLSYQNSQAKKITIENKILQTQQEIVNVRLEQNSANQDYTEKISKAEGDRYQSASQISSGQAEIAKLENQVSSYTIRNGMYIITAPQDGQIIQSKKSGIGEILKEGERLMMIVPDKINYAVEMFVRPVDLQLISLGQKVRFMFDGFPAIVFSGWPEGSYGTFGGTIIAYEGNISANGLYRVLVKEDPKDKKWPAHLKLGTGAQGIALIKDVPIWYELWRNINGFPPDYYKGDNKKEAK
ncbi:MAG: HlyD family secretion protein [Chitinophagales bacterium]